MITIQIIVYWMVRQQTYKEDVWHDATTLRKAQTNPAIYAVIKYSSIQTARTASGSPTNKEIHTYHQNPS